MINVMVILFTTMIMCGTGLIVSVCAEQNTPYPSAIINLTKWKLTLPIGADRSPTEIKQPILLSFVDTNYFHVNSSSDGVVFKAHCGGVTTSNSGYPRSELREMINDGTENASWSTYSGTHTMIIRQAITHLPDIKKHVVAGQIHDASDDVIKIRLENRKLFVEHNNIEGGILTSDYQLGTIFTVKIVAEQGRIKTFYNDNPIPVDDYAVKVSGCYFKAGCYTQSNLKKSERSDAYGEVIIYNLTVIH